jgi:hypothetical protein
MSTATLRAPDLWEGIHHVHDAREILESPIFGDPTSFARTDFKSGDERQPRRAPEQNGGTVVSAVTPHICPPFCHRCPNQLRTGIWRRIGCGEGLGWDFLFCHCGNVVCHCGAPSEGRCTWPIEIMAPGRVYDLRHGDICSNLSNTRTGTVTDIQALLGVPNQNLLEITIERQYKGATRGRVDVYRWDLNAQILILRRTKCGEPGCYRHIRDLDGGQSICSDHWGAQLALIA